MVWCLLASGVTTTLCVWSEDPSSTTSKASFVDTVKSLLFNLVALVAAIENELVFVSVIQVYFKKMNLLFDELLSLQI